MGAPDLNSRLLTFTLLSCKALFLYDLPEMCERKTNWDLSVSLSKSQFFHFHFLRVPVATEVNTWEGIENL